MDDDDAAAAYLRVMAELAGLSAERTAQRAEVERWYDGQRAASRRTVAEAEDQAQSAHARAQDARALVAEVDAEAGAPLAALRAQLGHAARRLGDPPAPSAAPPADADPRELLADADELLARARQPRSLPGWAYPALVVFGVLGAGVHRRGSVRAAPPRRSGRRRSRRRAAGPGAHHRAARSVAGLAPAKLLAERRGALDAGAVSALVVPGLATAGVLLVLLSSG